MGKREDHLWYHKTHLVVHPAEAVETGRYRASTDQFPRKSHYFGQYYCFVATKDTAGRNATVGWTMRESARAKLRVVVKHLLRKYVYPLDKHEMATQIVLEQAELFSGDWASNL